MITKYGKKSICGILTAILLISTAPISAHAAATYSAYEIISMIFAVVGGITLEHSQGLISSEFNPNALYESMNAQQAGIGTTLASYVNRAQYLGPGSDLLISEDDYDAFLEYFRQYNINMSLSGQITSSSKAEFIDKVNAFTGLNLQDLDSGIIEKINNGTYKYLCKFGYRTGGTYITSCAFCETYESMSTTVVKFVGYYSLWYNGYFITDYVGPGNGGEIIQENSLEAVAIVGGTGYKADTTTNGKIKTGTYDTISKSRAWDATQGKIVGRTTITMPARETLDDVLQRENVKDITDAVNVYPVDTADNSMVYYPTQSATDFVVPDIAVNANVSVQFPAIEGEVGAYTMDLTGFFPFCIPFDIYAFLQAFEAEPEAPSITYNFPYLNSAGNVVYIQQTYSLSQFDTVAQLVRRLELIAFIIGLAFVTRSFFLRG